MADEEHVDRLATQDVTTGEPAGQEAGESEPVEHLEDSAESKVYVEEVKAVVEGEKVVKGQVDENIVEEGKVVEGLEEEEEKIVEEGKIVEGHEDEEVNIVEGQDDVAEKIVDEQEDIGEKLLEGHDAENIVDKQDDVGENIVESPEGDGEDEMERPEGDGEDEVEEEEEDIETAVLSIPGSPQQKPESSAGTPGSPQQKPESSAGTPKSESMISLDSHQSATPRESSPKPETSEPDSQKADSPLSDDRVPTAPPPPEFGEGVSTPQFPDSAGPDPLNLIWSFGVNERLPLLNITDGSRKMIMYACGHTGVLYDVTTNKQKLLQGHSNNISCSCVSKDKRWLATGDKGVDSTIIVWDTKTGFPVRTIFEPFPEGIVAIAITPDAKYLATLSAGQTQVMAIWDWTTGDDTPIHTAQLEPRYGLQNFVLFNPEDTSQLVSNSDTQVVFYSWSKQQLEFFAPPLSDQDFNKPVGRFSQTIFKRHSTRALTATSLGNIVVWDSNKPLTSVGTNPTPDKKALKLVKLQDAAMKVLTTTDHYIVIGDALGHVRFLDQTLKLINWYHDFHLGPIGAISFAYDPEFDPIATETSDFPDDATIPARKFVIRDFAVASTNAVQAYVTSDGSDVCVIHREHDAPIYALDSHPNESKFVTGSYSGLLKVWDYDIKEALVSRYFERGQMIRCCAYDPRGEHIAVGFMNGTVRLLDAITLHDEMTEPYRYSRDAITHCAFSHDAQYLATTDAEFTLTLFRARRHQHGAWEYMGRRRAHYKLIVDLMFTVHLDSNLPRLLTLGEDRMLVEYDLSGSVQDDIVIANIDRIDQSATAHCLTMYPSITKEQFILTANDQYKFKLYNSTTKMCRKTLLGPTYGYPIQKMVVLPTDNPHTDPRYLAYVTVDKIGLTKLPLTGNPHIAMALTAHPSGVTNLVTSHDGRYVFTSGGVDAVVHMWNTNFDVLEAQAELGGQDLIPFYGLLDGGREGDLFAELEDYFYYAQIRSQGVNTMDTRQVRTVIPLTEVPFVMRAMGFYPSEQEVLDMVNEVKYGQYVETGRYVDDVDLGTFIKLYINHRPAFGLDPEELTWAFRVLADASQSEEKEDTIDRGYLLDVLQTRGEHMTEYELAEYITTLLGYNKEGGTCELQEFDPTASGDIISDNLPPQLTAAIFADKVLGFTLQSDVLTLDKEATFT